MSQKARLARLEAALEAATQRAALTAFDARRELYRRFARIRSAHEAAGGLTGDEDLAWYSKAERLALGDPTFGAAELQAHVEEKENE